MLTRDELVALYRGYEREPVLSVYVDADQHDPAQRDAWRIPLKGGLSAARRGVEASGDRSQLNAFVQAVEQIQDALGVGDASFLPGRGWVGFATASEMVHAESLPVPLPNLVRWEEGLRIAPYVRALKQARPVLLAIVDQRKAQLYRYREGALEVLTALRADTFVGDLTDVGTAKRATHRSGVRGKTGTDAAQSILEVAADRLVARLADEIGQASENDGFLVVGGIQERMAELEKSVPEAMAERMVSRPSIHFDMTDADLTAAVEDAASRLSSRLHERLVTEVVDSARSDGPGCLGREDTEEALHAQRVKALLVSIGLTERDPDYADHLIGTAFGSSGAEAHVLVREPGQVLDEEAGGVGALLHY